MVGTNNSRGGGVDPLRKPEARQVERAQTQLQRFQDEKHEKYSHHSDIAVDVFEKARQVRATLASVYEQRKATLDETVEELQETNETESKQILENLRNFSVKFEADLARGRKEWRRSLKNLREAVQRRTADDESEASRLHDLIKQEHENCTAHTSAEVGPIWEKLKGHSAALAKATSDRTGGHDEFRSVMKKNLGRLHQALSDESVARKRQFDDTMGIARRRLKDMQASQADQGTDLKKRLEQVKRELETERDDASKSIAQITGEMSDFMAHFERSVGEGFNKQEETKALFRNLKETIKSDG
eukprot:TRINITY_DN70448_c0_g1_i1.p1 TRINITY_DN70448_c0_g1~~TRINITY_DN70448_c0_g1_i1.p1  ORF type:complete len:302 (+),score=78.91 TRINITY_DN70448_c0_g1_i1:143-1048(+)